ncbi:MAG: efflux RND transporter permease subunit [Nitrospirae bacterium]|jgi:hydrophobic/amphiphilic exporter-1 (mainly G- bacteria), HAE1 family|nr:efflux RND transporter permease subunit [Nitrospirota bacterium]
MWLTNTAIKKPVFATMVIISLVVLGVVSYPSIGVDLFPKVEFPMVSIVTTLRGASPEIMDIDVTDKIEEAVNTINGVKTIMSTSTEGFSRVMVEFVLERDIDLAVQDVREKVSAIRRQLPRDIDEPVIEKVDPDATPVMWLSLSGEKSVRELSTYADEVLKEHLQRIEGVGAVRTGGLRLRQVRVWLDADKLKAYRITSHDVARALEYENIELPGGRIESITKEYTVKIKGEITEVQDFNDLIVAYHGGAPVRIRDVGRVEDGMQERRSIARFNGLPAVGLGIQKQSGTNTVEVIDRIKKELVTIKNSLPPGMRLGISFDQSDFIKRSIHEVQYQLVYGGLLAAFIVFVFLRNIKSTVIIALSIPISLISTLILINAFGFTFNNMTMLAFAIAIGTLIDNAIVVIENIFRHMEKGMTPREAALFSTSEIGFAIMAATFTTVVIFLPVAFMKGIIGMFFMEFGLTIVFALFISLFVAFTFTPMMASRYLKSPGSGVESQGSGEKSQESPSPAKMGQKVSGISARFDTGYKKIEDFYKYLLTTVLKHRIIVILFAIAAFLSGLFVSTLIGKEFHPPEDQGRFIVRLEAPIDYSVERVDGLFKNAEDIIRNTPEVKNVFYGQGLFGEVNKGIMFITLIAKAQRDKTQEQIMSEVRGRFREIAGLKGTAENVALIGGGVRMVPIQYSIRGRELSDIEAYANQIVEELSKLPGIVDVDTTIEAGKPELRVYIDRDKAADLGVDIATLAEAVNLLISGEVDVTKFKDETKGRRYDVRMRLKPEDRMNPRDIKNLHVRSKDGRLIELSGIVTIQEGGGPAVINRVDRQRAVTIFANLEGKPLGQAKAELDGISAGILPPDYSGIYKGLADVMGESFQYLLFAMILGIIMVYIVLASQFESFIHPFTILLSVPLSIVGAFSALLLTGNTLNIMSFVGIILLVGIVVNNGILLVSYTNTLRERGMGRKEAILHAGPIRLRPILMTTLSLILAMTPIAAGIGEGAETRTPMAVIVIGGLLSSLLLTLVVVPVVYDLLDDLQSKFFKKPMTKETVP